MSPVSGLKGCILIDETMRGIQYKDRTPRDALVRIQHPVGFTHLPHPVRGEFERQPAQRLLKNLQCKHLIGTNRRQRRTPFANPTVVRLPEDEFLRSPACEG